MANEYFTASGYPGTRAQGSSAALRAQLAAIASAFDKLPVLAGNGGMPIGINAGGTALEAIAAINGVTVGATTPSTGAFTTLASSSLVVSGATSVGGGISVTGGLLVTGTTALTGNLTVSGAITSASVSLSGNASVGGVLTVNNGASVANGLTVSAGGLLVTGSTNLTGNLTSSGTVTAAAFSGAISSGMVTSALGFTPYSNANPSGFISGISGAMVTSALGFTPYNATNPSGYISGITSGMVTTALGYTPPQQNGTGASGTWGISISGNAATATSASTAATATSATSATTATTAGACSGNAATATALQTARNINGVAFNGAADITVTADSPVSMYGEYTPTITPGTNMGSTTPGTCYWHRRGNYVTVDGNLMLQPITASGLTSAQITLPVASNLSSGSEGIGFASCFVSFDPGNLTGNVTTDKAEIFFNATYSGSQRQWNFHFTYKVQ